MAEMRRTLAGIVTIAALSGACTLQDVDPPPLTGPSTLALSLTAAASPDILPEDGRATSTITITARDQFGQPRPSVRLRVDTVVGNTIVDFGTLSARDVTTNASGQATVIYTAPLAPQRGVDTRTVVTIAVRPFGTDFFGSSTGTVTSIRLVPETTIGRQPGEPEPSFFYSPTNPVVGQQILFDASASRDEDGVIVRYRWDWGDGDASGNEGQPRQDHSYGAAGTYLVTLTVTDNDGKTASIVRTVVVS